MPHASPDSRLIQQQVRVLLNAAMYPGARLVEVLNVADLGTMDVLIRCDGFDCNGRKLIFQATKRVRSSRGCPTQPDGSFPKARLRRSYRSRRAMN